ncbi:MAG: 2-oxoglutarate dehydrogenase complex dihydrolipoyllysine-residue succinyltransferase [Geminicoccaceae bacterium]
MSVEIKVPTLGESVTEATVAKWFKKAGESVKVDETLVELETDKVTVEVNAPASGTIAEILEDEGAEVEVGALLGHLEEGDAPADDGAGDAKAAKEGDDQETKEADGKAASAIGSAEGQQSAKAESKADPSPKGEGAGPAARKLAEEKGIDLKEIEGTGPKGNVTKEDVRSAMATKAPSPDGTPPPVEPSPAMAGRGGEERVKMTRLRKRIAERLKEAQNTAAMLTTFNEVDLTAVMALRKKHQDRFVEKHGLKLGFMSFFVKASIEALKAFPAVNAEIDGDEIVYKHYYDIGVAVSTSSGLVVPVVRGADVMSFAQIEQTIVDLGKRARDGKLAMDELMGGTFTISNGGVFGSMLSTPILNPPQVGILGMHKTQTRPMVMADGSIQARPMMYLALSYDHRIIDGREAVSFLVRVKECIEDPGAMLLDA